MSELQYRIVISGLMDTVRHLCNMFGKDPMKIRAYVFAKQVMDDHHE